MVSRRDFLRTGLQTSTLFALAPTVPGFLAQTARAMEPDRDGRILVVVQPSGGNDGVNTVVPFADEGYAKHRKVLRLPAERLHKITKEVGLHPAMADAARLLEDGRLAIVQGVGYPNPSRSHFKSMAIWHSANVNLPKEDALDAANSTRRSAGSARHWTKAGKPADGSPVKAQFVGSGSLPLGGLPGAGRSVASAITRPEDSVLTLKWGAQLRGRDGNPARRGPGGVRAAAARWMPTWDLGTDGRRYSRKAEDRGVRYPATELGRPGCGSSLG